MNSKIKQALKAFSLAWVGFFISLTLAFARDNDCSRIVSLAPSVTEVLADLELSDRLVGRTHFCRYPASVLGVTPVGGYLDLNIERILLTRPTVVFGLLESSFQIKPLERFGVEFKLLDHSSIAGIKASYDIIATRCGIKDKAEERLRYFKDREDEIRQGIASVLSNATPPRVLVAVGRTREGSDETGVYVSGSDGFYSGLVSLVGGVNVHQGRTMAVPTLSVEGILKLAPQVIVDVINQDDQVRLSQARRFWQRFPNLPAVKNGKVLVIGDDYASIPGPRYLLLAEKIAKVMR